MALVPLSATNLAAIEARANAVMLTDANRGDAPLTTSELEELARFAKPATTLEDVHALLAEVKRLRAFESRVADPLPRVWLYALLDQSWTDTPTLGRLFPQAKGVPRTGDTIWLGPLFPDPIVVESVEWNDSLTQIKVYLARRDWSPVEKNRLRESGWHVPAHGQPCHCGLCPDPPLA